MKKLLGYRNTFEHRSQLFHKFNAPKMNIAIARDEKQKPADSSGQRA